MKMNKLIYLVLFIAIIGTTSITSAATEATWNNITFTVPDGYNTGTPSAEKIAMVNGGDRILIQTFDEDGLNELKNENGTELKINETFKMNGLEINQLGFESEKGTKYLFLFSKNNKDYQISYFEPAPVEEETDGAAEATENTTENTTNNTTDNNATTENTTNTSFNIQDTSNPVNVIINSLKF